ncbi:hypothetical protein [Polyangium sp. 15x6]|uniref:hypothetical protein n=1 Tax=Polyangium sp. 15x6 TaxID=3042687 RepID=UPI00249AF195|nr:hypothetical protein [Polyangium sp. 15x6]MDI3284052.1 hypothetical protein [Polyangium sp. 15x6]
MDSPISPRAGSLLLPLVPLLGLLSACGTPETPTLATPAHGGPLDGPSDPPVLDLFVSPEVPLDTPVLSPAPGSRAQAAYGNGQYLVAWSDFRAFRHILYGARLDASGTVLDTYGIPLLTNVITDPYLGWPYRPAVAFDGANYLVVTSENKRIRGVRVSPSGALLDPGGFDVSAAGVPAGTPAITFDGTNYLVTWRRIPTQAIPMAGLYHARVTPGGVVLDPGGVLDFEAPICGEVDASFDGTNHFVAFTDEVNHQVRAARLSPQGVLLDPAGLDVSPFGSTSCVPSPAVAFDGQSHVVAWRGYDVATEKALVKATRVTPQGALLDPSGIVLHAEFQEFESYERFDAAADGAGTIIAFSGDGADDGGGFWLSPRWTAIDKNGGITLPTQSMQGGAVDVALAPNGAGALFTYTSWPDLSDPDGMYAPVAGIRLGAGGAKLDPTSHAITQHGHAEEVRGAASNGTISLVVWTDARPPHTDGLALHAARVGASGAVLDPAGIKITDQTADEVAVTFDGANFVVFFVRRHQDNNNPLQAVRVSPQGVVLDAAPVVVPICMQGNYGFPAVAASDGQRTLVVGRGCDLATYALATVALDQNLAPLGPTVALGPYDHTAPVHEPQVAWNGTNHLVIWNDSSRVYGRRVSSQGVLLDAAPFEIVPEGPSHRMNRLAADGTNHFVVWQDESQLRGTRVSPAGQILDSQGIPLAQVDDTCQAVECCRFGWSSCPAIAFDGTNYLLAWRSMTVPGDVRSTDLHAASMSPEGAMGPTFFLSQAPEHESPAALTVVGGKVLGAYTRFDASPPASARRAFVREIDLQGMGGGGGTGGMGGAGSGGTGGGGGTGGMGGAGSGGTGGSGGSGGMGGMAGEGGAGDDGGVGGGNCDCEMTAPTKAAPSSWLLTLAGFAFLRRRGRLARQKGHVASRMLARR